MSLDRSAILAAADRKTAPLEVPEWGGTVYLRTLTGLERDALEAEITKNGGKVGKNFRARFCALVLADESGKRLFEDKDADALAEKSGAVLGRICEAAFKHNGIGPEEVQGALGESAGDQS